MDQPRMDWLRLTRLQLLWLLAQRRMTRLWMTRLQLLPLLARLRLLL